MQLFIFGKFHAREGCEDALGEAMRKVVLATREEPGCLEVHGFRSVRDPRLLYLHSHWVDEASFDQHAELPHTLQFLQQVEALLDHPRDVSRTTIFV
ncbi:MAG: putative quinol monooxygenase [Candidatus Korobacteraceae bacterium]